MSLLALGGLLAKAGGVADPALTLPAIPEMAPGQPGGWFVSPVGLTAGGWTDMMGNGDLVAVGAPTVAANAFGARPLVTFNQQWNGAAQDSWFQGTGVAPLGANPGTFWIGVLARVTKAKAGGEFSSSIMAIDGDTSFADTFVFEHNGVPTDIVYQHFIGANNADDGSDNNDSADMVAGTLVLVETMLFDKTQRLRYFISGAEEADHVADVRSLPIGTFDFEDFVLGNQGYAPFNQGLVGQIGAAFAIPSVPTQARRQAVYDKLVAIFPGLVLASAPA